ncbi:MAG TPA: hypothetical protein VLV81_09960 [Acidimicrobiia bacterium]|nr:hypothetical protein [Acidimicrobiia bacterium]
MTRGAPGGQAAAGRRRRTVGVVIVILAALVSLGGRASPAAPGPTIAWSQLRNPILAYPDRALKDPALVWSDHRWVALFSQIGLDARWTLGLATSADLVHWSPPATLPHDLAVEGDASPDVVPDPRGGFVITDQSFVHDVAGGQAKLYYRTTRDFRTVSAPRPLAHSLHPGASDRMIDAALAWTPAGLLLGYKVGAGDGAQAFEIARSATGSLDGPWSLIGRPDIRVLGDTIENYQFLLLNGHWQLLATSNQFDRPYLFALAGNPHDPRGWLHWSTGQPLRIPQEAWNTGHGTTGVSYEHANAAFLVNRAPVAGSFYVIYGDASELTTFAGSGHDELALARSTDLRHWTVPPH